MLSWRSIRLCVTACLALALVLSGFMLSGAHDLGPTLSAAIGHDAPRSVDPTPKPAAPAPVVHTQQTVVPSAPVGAAHDLVAELPLTHTTSYGMVGVTWSPKTTDTDITVKFRALVSGRWAAWRTLGLDDEQPGVAGRPGTEPIWVGKADGVAVRVSTKSGVKPTDIKVVTIDPGGSTSTVSPASTDSTRTDTAAATSSAAYTTSGVLDGTARVSNVVDAGDGTPSFTPKPTIISRASWGAGPGTQCDSPLTGNSTHGVVVHHTAGSNSYSMSDSAKIVRGIQAYHTQGHGWCDIGYNFLVDKYGQIFEGRKGGVDRQVRAAHSGNGEVNTYDMGVSMMGDYDKVHLSSALETAMVKLVGWRMGTNYLKAKGTYKVTEKSLTLNMIAGHRNVVGTECPGRYGYAWLSEKGGLRDRVEAYMSKYSSPIKTLYTSLGSSRAGAIYIGEAASSSGRRLDASVMDMYAKSGATTAHYVSGLIRTEFDRKGGPTSVVGYPRGNPVTSSGTSRQSFDNGLIYAVKGKSMAYSIVSDVADTYMKLGAYTGVLGLPTGSTATVSTGVLRSNFEHGYIIMTRSTGKTIAYSSTGKPVSGSTTAAGPGTVRLPTVKIGVHSVRVYWTAVAGATTYDVCLLADKTQTSCTRLVTGVHDTTLQMVELNPTEGTDYYVKVRALDGGAKGSWSSLRGFNLNSPDAVTVPSTHTIAVTGHGYGHGIGMSQYGAQGAAMQGVTYSKILLHYYPGTALGTKTGNIRVLISQDSTDPVDVAGSSGLVFRDIAGRKTLKLPTTMSGKTVIRWRMVQVTSDKTRSTLQYRTTGDYQSYKATRWVGTGQLEGPSSIGLILPDGSTVKYRGAIWSAKPSSGSTARNTVNVLPIESYVRGVVAAEMPSSWMSEALKAQAVAARTYGVRSITGAGYYDICSTTSCQVYGGASRETSSTDSAVNATAGRVLTYDGRPAFTQFSSSSGGYTSPGSQPYLKAISDPWDDWNGNPNHSWTATVTAARIEKAYPSIGTLKQITVTKRNGSGDWGGRVSTISLVGSSKSVTITGDQARSTFALKSNWFKF
jgi:SpoIID/LytB domain protein